MEVCKVEFNIWCEKESEAKDLSQALQDFVNEHGTCGRAVTARRVTDAIRKWEDNYLVRSRIIRYLEKDKGQM